MPEVAGGWPEEGAQYAPGAPMEPVQQAYPPQAPYQTQQPYQQQGYEPQYQQAAQAQAQQQYAQPQYAQQPYPQQDAMPQQAVSVEDERSSLPSEFDHLFRDSAPEGRRAISGRQPMVSGPGASPSPGFQQAQPQPVPAQMQPTQVAQQAPAATAMYSPPQQQGYDGPGQPLDYSNGPFSYDGPPGGGSGNRRTPLIIGAVVAVIAVVGLYLGLSGGGSGKPSASATTSVSASPKSTESAQQEADAVYQLVKQAKQLREDISAGVGRLRECDISAAQSQINSTAQGRQSAATKVAQLPVDKISGASALVSALQKAWQDSAASDESYAKAAADFASGNCSKGAINKDPNYQAAQSGSGTSQSDKTAAATLWNSVMSKYEPSITESDL